jgi:L-fucose isomerase-like protein
MKHAMDIKINVKPVFSNMVHSGVWEGPCRVGRPDELEPSYEAKIGKEQFKLWTQELHENLNKYVHILEPVYIQIDETYVVSDKQFEKLENDTHEVDLYLITYRVPGIERFKKPIAMISLGPTPIDLVGFYRDIGIDAYMAHDYEEFNGLVRLLQVRKAIAHTKILILSETEQFPVTVNTSIPDLYGLYQRYGIRNSRIPFRNVFDQMEKMETTKDVKHLVDSIFNGATKTNIQKELIVQDVKFYKAVQALMDKFGCNAFTTSCFGLCASKYPMKYKCTPCLTHSLLKDDKIPSSCEEDVNVLMAMMVLMYLTKQSVFMGNPVLVKKGSEAIKQLGTPSILFNPARTFDEDVLEIHHAVPGIKMEGFENPSMPYQLGHFTYAGWGSKIQVDMATGKTKTVTMGRFNRSGDRMIVARGEILDCVFEETYCSPVVYYRIEGGVREFRQALAKGCYGHHLAVVYGDHIEDVKKLGEIVHFNVEVHK